jgi:hypothetical protein
VTRRNFINALSAFALDPERLLWRPGARLISIPKFRVVEFYYPSKAAWVNMMAAPQLYGGVLVKFRAMRASSNSSS